MTKEEIKKFKEESKMAFLDKVSQLAGLKDFNDAILNGYSIKELEEYSSEASKYFWKDEYNPKAGKSFPFRTWAEEYLNNRFGDKKVYFKSDAFVKHKINKMGDTMYERYGYRNPGESLEHRSKMSKGSSCTNPFSGDSFSIRAYIRGVSTLPEDGEKYTKYRIEVDRLTNINKKEIEFTGVDYYTGDIIYKYDGNNKVNRNDWNVATIDHKIPALRGFMLGISPEIIASPNNLCWTSKYFNSFKNTMTEQELRLSGIIERYKEVRDRVINENN